MNLKYVVPKKSENLSINQILKNELGLSTRLLQKLIGLKKIYLNNEIIDTRLFCKENDILEIDFSYQEDNSNIVPCKMNLDIVYEDDFLLIVNKPAGIATHPSCLHFNDSLSNGVKFYFDEINLHKKIRPVNRLDLNTSGLVIFAKNEFIQESLIKQKLKKEYLALATGSFSKKASTIIAPIDRKDNSIIERCVSEYGKSSITHYEVLKNFGDFSFVKCILETGRTHQIRVHFAHIGHPLLGDDLYGSKSCLISRQALHCFKLGFSHPITNETLVFIAKIPSDFDNIINKMSKSVSRVLSFKLVIYLGYILLYISSHAKDFRRL